ncbi:MAG: hypothetical protein KHX03_02905 [Clostridium sp.]|nr:hypothetical protein [Clostridium sp.]
MALGVKKIILGPTKNDLKLIAFLEENLLLTKKLSEETRKKSKKIYETGSCKLKDIFDIPENIKHKNINSEINKIKTASTLNELLEIEDKLVNNVYQWFFNSIKQQKSLPDFITKAEKIKNGLYNEIENLIISTYKNMDESAKIPDELNKSFHSKKIIKDFKAKHPENEKEKLNNILEYTKKVFNEDAKIYFKEYSETFERLVTQKNNLIRDILEKTANRKSKILSSSKSIKNNKFNGSCLCESIKNNPFVKFITSGKAKNHKPEEWMNFINESMGKQLSYKDIELLEKRMEIRQGISKADDNLLKELKKNRMILFEFFKKNTASKGNNINFENLANDDFLKLTNTAQQFKERYGVSSLTQMLNDIMPRTIVKNESVLFKIQTAINKQNNKNYTNTDSIIDRINNFFEWEEILKSNSI